jgi:hypothetical protein
MPSLDARKAKPSLAATYSRELSEVIGFREAVAECYKLLQSSSFAIWMDIQTQQYAQKQMIQNQVFLMNQNTVIIYSL